MSNVLYVQNLQQQLAAALSACKQKDDALLAVKSQHIDGHLFPAVVDMNAWHTKVINALIIQPDDSALVAWLGEPVAFKYQNANTDNVYLTWKQSPGGRNWTPLYAPKEN